MWLKRQKGPHPGVIGAVLWHGSDYITLQQIYITSYHVTYHVLSQTRITGKVFPSNGRLQWRIQDFPEGGAWTLQGGREHAKFSRKLHEIERIWTPRGGRASLTPPPRSANGLGCHREQQ